MVYKTNANYGVFHRNMTDRVTEIFGTIDHQVHFSAWLQIKVGDDTWFIDNLDQIPVFDRVVIQEESFRSNPMICPTWTELLLVAEEQIKHTQDFDHFFVEGIYQKDNGNYKLAMAGY